MDKDLFALIQEAKAWLASRPEPAIASLEWHTYNQLRAFVALLEKDSSLASLELAIQNLRRYMVKNFDWSVDYCTTVSRFCAKADHLRRRMHGATSKLPPVETQH